MSARNIIKYSLIIATCVALCSFGPIAKAAVVGDSVTFNVEPSFDAGARQRVDSVLIKTSPGLYLYVEKSWWNAQVPAKQQEISANLDAFAVEFNNRIYPILTSAFGSEWRPGVDSDNNITILFEAMKGGASGYFRSADEYIKLQLPSSNEREMLYISLDHIDDSQLKAFVAHEFVHLITFNQKERLWGVTEETWLNEGRADYASTILGYDDVYDGSNLQRRVQDFLEKPSDSLTEWQENKYDYASVNLFIHYLVDQYGVAILTDSLKSNLVGIASINQALLKNGAKEDFNQIFTNWTIATVVNDCSQNIHYCYLNKNLKNFRINPPLNFLPLSGDSSLSVTNVTKSWSGNWQKIIGGSGELKVNFSSSSGLNFQVPYLVFNKTGKYSVAFLTLDSNEKGTITVPDFGTTNIAVVLVPSLQSKLSGFDGLEPTYPYTFTASIGAGTSTNDDTIQKLLDQIALLKVQIAQLLAQRSGQPATTCALADNLAQGSTNKTAVRCLQSFLASQGASIYPEGLVTGVFGPLTRMAVIRFQERYSADVLVPAGLAKGTGFVGVLTRNKINQLMTQ